MIEAFIKGAKLLEISKKKEKQTKFGFLLFGSAVKERALHGSSISVFRKRNTFRIEMTKVPHRVGKINDFNFALFYL